MLVLFQLIWIIYSYSYLYIAIKGLVHQVLVFGF